MTAASCHAMTHAWGQMKPYTPLTEYFSHTTLPLRNLREDKNLGGAVKYTQSSCKRQLARGENIFIVIMLVDCNFVSL